MGEDVELVMNPHTGDFVVIKDGEVANPWYEYAFTGGESIRLTTNLDREIEELTDG